MVLKQVDFEAIKNGAAHTPEAPIDASVFIRMTREEIKAKIESKLSRIKTGYEKRLLAKCLEIKTGIKNGTLKGQELNNQLVDLRYSRGNPSLFQSMQKELVCKSRDVIISGNVSLDELHNMQSEIDFLNLYNLSNFLGEITGANVVLLNGSMQFRVDDSPEVANEYITMLLNSIIYSITKENENENCIDYESLESNINSMLEYNGFEYNYKVEGDKKYKHLDLLRALLWLLPAHIKGTIKTLHVKNIGEIIQISGDYGEGNKIKKGGQMPNSYIGQLDAGNFLKWLVEKNSDILSLEFDEENHKFIFTLKQ